MDRLKSQLTEGIHYDVYTDKGKADYLFSDINNFWDKFSDQIKPIFFNLIEKIVSYNTDMIATFEILTKDKTEYVKNPWIADKLEEITLTSIQNLSASPSEDYEISKKHGHRFDIKISDKMRGTFKEENFIDLKKWVIETKALMDQIQNFLIKNV